VPVADGRGNKTLDSLLENMAGATTKEVVVLTSMLVRLANFILDGLERRMDTGSKKRVGSKL
jgi:predicted double-glycine peptidase